MMKTEHAEQWAGGTVALAEIFGITHNAVSQWGETIPRSREFELRVKRPEWVADDGTLKPFDEKAAERVRRKYAAN